MSEAPGAPRPNPYVLWFIMGLPLGLVVLGALSFVIYFHKRNLAEAPPKPSQLSGMMRKDLNLDDFKRYAAVFKDRIGQRTLDKADNVAIAASYIASSMGFDNMGYQITRRAVELPEGNFDDLAADLPGVEHPDQIVLVVARYDENDPSAISALLCLAHSLTGTRHANTVRFLALVAGAEKDGKYEGAEAYRQAALNEGDVKAATVVIQSGTDHGPRMQLRGEHAQFTTSQTDPDVLNSLKQIGKTVTSFADAPLLK